MLAAPSGSAVADEGQPSAPPATVERVQVAQRALAEATEVLSGGLTGRDATMALRDLALTQADLPATQRAAADRILARPTDGANDPLEFGYEADARPLSFCNGAVCVWWDSNTSNADAPDGTSGTAVPEYVKTVSATMNHVHGTYVSAGYRAPKADGTAGGNSLTDIYLVDIGERGLYGYCSSDRRPSRKGAADIPAYCTLDEDYAVNEFGTRNTSLQNLQVTAAHEYFHAVQFAYDASEDGWFMEATAAWVEDEVYPDVNDNVIYLRRSPMRDPEKPADTGGNDLRIYGSWILFRYLTEQSPAEEGGLPTLVRDIWRQADSVGGAPDQYSLKAVKTVLKDRGFNFTKTFARFSAANRRPAQTYAEGFLYKPAKPAATVKLGARGARTGTASLDHLSSLTVRVKPQRSLKAKGWKLRVGVDLGAKATGSAAIVTTYQKGGGVKVKTVKLGRAGGGQLKVPFSARKTRYVEVTLVNASTRFRCGKRTVFSCQGQPRDDNLKARLRVSSFR